MNYENDKKYIKAARENLAKKGFRKTTSQSSSQPSYVSPTRKELKHTSISYRDVDSDYIQSFLTDADNMLTKYGTAYNETGHTKSVENLGSKFSAEANDLDERAKAIRAYRRIYGDKLSEEESSALDALLGNWVSNRDEYTAAYSDKLKRLQELNSTGTKGEYFEKDGNIYYTGNKWSFNKGDLRTAESGTGDALKEAYELYGGDNIDFTEPLKPISKAKAQEEFKPLSVEGLAHNLEEIQKNKGWFKSGAFDHQPESFGDAMSMALEGTVGTAADITLRGAKGFTGFIEGIGDKGMHYVAGALDILGDDYMADQLRDAAAKDGFGTFLDPAIDFVSKSSFLGEKSQFIPEGLGQIGALAATAQLGGAAKGTVLGSSTKLGNTFAKNLPTIAMYESSSGQALNEAYQVADKSDLQRWIYAGGIGAVEAGSELLFGGLGRGINALGANRGLLGLDDYLAQKLTSKITNRFLKNGLQYALKSGGEGVEELFAGLGSAAVTKFTGMSDDSLSKLIKDENLLDAFGSGMLLSAIAQSGGLVSTVRGDVDYVTGRADIANMAIQAVFDEAVAKAEADGKVLTNAEKNELWDKAAKMVDEGMSAVEESSGNASPITKTPGVYNAVPGKNGSYEISRTAEDGVSEAVELESLSKSSPEYKIFRAAEDAHMTPAVAAKLVNDYNETGDINNYIDEAVYVSAAAKAGTSYEALSKGAGVLSEDVRRAIWDDGRIYSENKVKARQTFLNEIKTKASGNILAGKFNKTDIEGMKLNSAQQRAVDVADALSGLGFNIRMVKDINGNRKFLGYYDKKTGDIVLSVNARAKDVNKVLKTQLLPTLSHEVTHSMKNTSPEIYAQYSEIVLGALYSKGELDGIVNREFNRLRDSGRYEEMSDSEIYDAAYDEIVARASEDMLADPKAIEKICRENRTVGEKILEAIDRFISTLKDILSGKWEKSVHLEAEILRDMQKEYETARDLWVKALADTAEARAALSEAGDVVREDGTPVASGFDSGEIQLNEATYEEEGRAVLEKYLNRQVKSKKLSRADADDILNNLDRIYDTMKTFAGKYAPYAAWAEAKVIRDGKGKPVFSVVTPNGDYSMNIDFSLVCKKRRMLDAVFNRMIERGLIDDFSLGKEEIVKINNIIKEHNFEIACALCFVDAKRFRQAGVADSFVEIYNGIVNEITPDGVEVPYFNFGGNKTLNTEGKGLDGVKVDNSVFQRYINEYGEKSVEGKVAKHLRDYPADRKLLHRGDFLSTAGFDAVKRQNPEILSLFNSKKGSGGPKSAFSDTQYLNEIIASRTFNAAKAFAVDGVRVQSFSDYIPRLVFDYCQMVGDLAAKRLPAHAYSKEDLFVKQFGKTGIKINMSLIPKIVDGGVAPGLDADGNYAWADESFDFDTAKKIQNADGYTDNCGTICVGVSREHILKLLGDPDIRMVIPYHKSGLNPIVAQMNKIAEFKDYTNEQNTRYTNEDGTAGSKLSDEDVKSQPNVNALMQKGMTAKEAAQAYLDWCDQKGYTPKFDEFKGEENYYKLLIDFVCYNKNGDFVPQGAVKMNFPNAEDKFGSMAKLIESGLEADAVTQYRQNKELDPIVDEITKVLGSDLQFNEALDDELTMREVLTGALEGAALTEADAKVLERYRRRVREIDGYDERLREVNREIKEISFAKGKRDTARLSELKSEKAKLEQDLKRADRKLLELSSTEALKNLFDREAKRLRREKSEALRAASKEARRMSEAQLKEAVEKERERGAAAKAGERMAAEAEIAEIRRRAAERELKDRTRRERNAVKRKIEKLTSYITTQTDKKNVKEGIKGAALEFMRVVTNDSGTPFTPSQLGRLREAYAALEYVSEGSSEVIYEGAYDFDILEDIKVLEKTLAGRAWRDLTLEELDIVEEVTDNLKHMIQEENRIFRVDKSVSRKAFGKAAEEDVKKIKSMGKNRVKKLLITENLTPDTFFGKLGGIFESLYWDAMKGQNKAARVYVEAKGRVDETVERFGGEEKLFTFKHGSYDKKHRVFKTEDGQMFELTADEAMYLYAVYKRETISGKTNHILGGGIKTDGLIKKVKEVTAGGKTVYKPKGKTAKGNVSLTELDISRISASLTDTQRAFADSLVKYLSDDMAKLGNETSMKLYGIKKYKESYYIPFKISATDRHTTQEEMAAPDGGSKGGGKNVAITSKGFSKELHRGANNPIVVSSFMDVFSDHVVEMANYNAFALTSEAFRSIENYRTEDGILLKSKLNAALGENGYSYYKKFLSDLNGGLNAGDKSGFEKLIALQKKGAIFMSLSVAIQQSVAIVRAANEIDPKYLFAVRSIKNTDSSEKTALWEEMKRYAPGVTVTKEMGRFDTATGLSAKEYIYSRNENIGEVAMDVADTIGGFLPEWADKLAWMQIWKACKAEVSAKRGLTGEALMNAVGERFTEVINKTQVYDSFLSKSGSMRNQNELSKMVTAFMAEPLRNLNMLYEAYTSGDGVKMARATTVFLLQTVINSALVSLIRAIRDDDEEKTFEEKYVSELTGKIIDEISLWNSVPYLRDISSILQGYDVDRTDMTLIGSVASKGLSMLRDDEGFTAENITDLIGEASTLTGVPAKNLIRDVKGIWRLITTEGPDSRGMTGLKYVVHDELFGNSTTGAILKKAGLYLGNTDYDGYIEALESGDSDEAEKIFGAIIDYKVFKARRKAEAKDEEFYEDEARDNAISSVKSKTTEHLKGNYEAYLAALNSGNANKAAKEFDNVSQILTQVYKFEAKAKGKKFDEKETEKKIKSAFQSRVTEHFKPIYVRASEDERTRIREILRGTKLYKKNIRTLCKEWLSDD